MRKQLFMVALMLISISSTFAQIQAYKLKKGDAFEVVQDVNITIDQEVMGSSMQVTQKVTTTDMLEVLSVSKGVYEMKFTALSRKLLMNIPMAGEQVMDSEGSTDMDKPFKAMVNKSFTFMMDQFGQIQEFRGLDEAKEQVKAALASANMGGADQVDQVVSVYSEDVLRASMSSQFGFYAGDSSNEWTRDYNSTVNNLPVNLTVKHWYDSDNSILAEGSLSIKGDVEQMGMTMSTNMEGTQNTIYDLSASGMPTKVQTKQDAEGTMMAQGMEIPMKLTTNTTTTYTKK